MHFVEQDESWGGSEPDWVHLVEQEAGEGRSQSVSRCDLEKSYLWSLLWPPAGPGVPTSPKSISPSESTILDLTIT